MILPPHNSLHPASSRCARISGNSGLTAVRAARGLLKKETQGKSDAGEVTDRKTESTVSQQRDMHGGNTKSFL